MKCVSPGHHWVTNPLTGHRSWMPFPCGHCVACLHNTQDAWAIRLNEEAKRTDRHEFIYDTLTFSPQGMPYSFIPEVSNNSVSESSLQLLRKFTSQYNRLPGVFLEKGLLAVPNVSRQLIRDWIRRGRELFVYDNGFRPRWKYVVFMEYGPKTSRPHFHLMFFNISHGDYVRYLAKPWRRTYGFTKTKVVNNKTPKGRQCVSRYVSKYCSKGVFESPLVSDSLVPKPFRCISHGIGEGYLETSRFSSFSHPLFEHFREVQAKPFYSSELGCSCGYDYSRISRYFNLFGFSRISDLLKPSDLDSLQFYVDESSFKHSLPRYYKNKLLLSHKPNYFSCAVQDLLSSRYSEYNKGRLFEFALCMGYKQAQREAPFLGFSFEQWDALSRQFASSERMEAKVEAKRYFIKLKNHYLRPLRDKAYSYVS